jgi:hypothetical protein
VKLLGAQRRRETTKPLLFLELIKIMYDWPKNKAAVSKCETSRTKFIRQVPEIDGAVFTFFRESSKAGINCIALFLQHIEWLTNLSKIQLSTVILIHI